MNNNSTPDLDIKSYAKNYFSVLKQRLADLDYDRLVKAVETFIDAYRKKKKIYVFGNGGSATLASHFACDFGKTTLRRVYDSREGRIQIISLSDNMGLVTAYANDTSFDDVFVQQLQNLIEPGDIAIAITGSGNSPNIIKALKYAKSRQAITIGLLGFYDGGEAAKYCDIPIIVQSRHYGHIEGIHTEIEHFFTEAVHRLKMAIDFGPGSPIGKGFAYEEEELAAVDEKPKKAEPKPVIPKPQDRW